MKISELKNAPEWLVKADTENADVNITSWGWVIWNSGDFRGGNFLGGDFLGGDFLGGNFRGGNFLGGNFLGGNFRGGNFRGGNFLGGNFLGGVMMPHCKWIYGVTADGLIRIGCETRSREQWDIFFAEGCTEQLSTERGSVAFKKIRASYEATKAYLAIINPSAI